jgi:threonine/homoserine/homoserine lactone efflux protein
VIRAVLSFALVAGLLTLIPGLDTALVLRAAISQGRRPAFATALGISCGALVWGAAAAAGVSALLVASRIGYDALRIAGAVYLVLLGARLLLAAYRAGPAADPADDPDQPAAGRRRGQLLLSWRRGFATNLLNPKVGAFYVAVLPQFIPEHSWHLGFGVLLALVHDLEGMVWFTILIYFATRLRTVLATRAVRRGVDATTGVVLVGFGVGLALDGG